MGGNIAVTIKTTDGQIHKMDRWTNPTTAIFSDIDFFNEGDTLTEYLDAWYEMCAAYDNGTYESTAPMAPMYCDESSCRGKIAPSSYGIVFVDMQAKKFYSLSAYATYQEMFGLTLKNRFRHNAQENIDWAERMYKYINSAKTYDYTRDDIPESIVDLKFTSAEEFINYVNSQKGEVYYMFEIPGWEFVELPYMYGNNAKTMVELIQSTGIKLSTDELAAFEELDR